MSDDLRSLIADTVREVVGELVTESVRGALTSSAEPSGVTAAARPPLVAVPSSGATADVAAGRPALAPLRSAGRSRVQAVRIRDDRDLEEFARHLLELFENPKNRQDLRAGRHRFTLAPSSGSGSPGSSLPVRRVERGAVTERHVNEAAAVGERIVLGPRAVLTPLARERARSLGVEIEKERSC